MFWLIKQVFIALLSFSGWLETKFVSLNNEPCMNKPTLIVLNLIKLNCYTFMISLDKFNGSCNVLNGLSTKICVPNKTNERNVEIFNTISRINEAKPLATYFI